MTSYYSFIHTNLSQLIVEFEKEIMSREKEMDGSQAQIFLDDLNSLQQRFLANETNIETECDYTYEALAQHRPYHLKLTKMKAKLASIVSRHSSTPSAESNQSNRNNQTDQLKTTPDNTRDLKSRIQEQQLLIKKIDRAEIDDNVCEVKARVLYDHVEKLYEWFVSNQVQIEAQVDETALVDQQTIALQTQRKVIEIQTRLKKIIADTENARKSNATIESNPNNENHQADISDLDSLVKKSDFLIDQIKSLKPKGDICADEAKIIFDLLASLYQIFVKNQMQIQAQTKIPNFERKVARKVQRYVVQLQTKLKRNFDQAPAPLFTNLNQVRSTVQAKMQENGGERGPTELATVNNLINLFNEMLISQHQKFDQYVCENGSNTTFSSTTSLDNDVDLEIMRDIQSRIITLQTKQNEMCSDLESIQREERK